MIMINDNGSVKCEQQLCCKGHNRLGSRCPGNNAHVIMIISFKPCICLNGHGFIMANTIQGLTQFIHKAIKPLTTISVALIHFITHLNHCFGNDIHVVSIDMLKP